VAKHPTAVDLTWTRGLRLPPKAEREAGEREMVRRMYEDAWAHDDALAAGILVAYERNRFRDMEEKRHPAAVVLEHTAAEVEVPSTSRTSSMGTDLSVV